MSISRRIGRFYIDRKLVDDQPEMVMLIMAECIVVECKLQFVRNRFEYWAVSPVFDELEPGQIEPDYSVNVYTGGAKPEVRFSRISA